MSIPEPVIDEKKKFIQTTYIDNTSASEEQRAQAKQVLEAYDWIENEKEYVETRNGGELKNITNDVPATEKEAQMPTDYIWTCRKAAPYIEVSLQAEGDLKTSVEDMAKDPCYDAVDLAWIVCPVIKWFTSVTDTLTELVEGFF